MLTNCLCLNWAIVEKYPDAQDLDAFLDEEESDKFKKTVPSRIWLSDSTIEYHQTSDVLAELTKHVPPQLKPPVGIMSSCISYPLSIDELGLGRLPDTGFYASLSPGRVEKVLEAFRSVDFAELAAFRERMSCAQLTGRQPLLNDSFVSYLKQWHDTLAFAAAIKYGLLGGRG